MADKKLKLVEELRALDEGQLNERLITARRTLVEHQRALASQELPSAAVIRKTRREIATTMTLLTEKRRAADAQKEEK